MANYLDYLAWRGDLTFDRAPFNEIDSAILAEISYLPFEELDISAHEISSIREAVTGFLEMEDLEDKVTAQYHIDLIKALASGERFIDLPILDFRNIFDFLFDSGDTDRRIHCDRRVCADRHRGNHRQIRVLSRFLFSAAQNQNAQIETGLFDFFVSRSERIRGDAAVRNKADIGFPICRGFQGV